MSLNDPIGDMLSIIKYSQSRNHKKVELPSSKFKIKIADVLKNEGYIIDYKTSSEEKKPTLEILILPILDIKIPYKLFLHQFFVSLHQYLT